MLDVSCLKDFTFFSALIQPFSYFFRKFTFNQRFHYISVNTNRFCLILAIFLAETFTNYDCNVFPNSEKFLGKLNTGQIRRSHISNKKIELIK